MKSTGESIYSEFFNDLEKLITVLPPRIIDKLRKKDLSQLVEIVLDTGRLPEVRYLDNSIEYLC